MLNERNEPMTDASGARIPRMSEPECDLCEKHLAGFEAGWLPGNEWRFLRYMAASRLRQLPRPGGLDEQDGDELVEMVRMAMIEDTARSNRDAQRQESLLASAVNKAMVATFGGR